jgi:hypothetical protein
MTSWLATSTPAWQMGLQMTPFDEWDFDGVNDDPCRHRRQGQPTKALVHFDRVASATRPIARRCAARRREIRSGGELGDECRHEDRPSSRQKYSTAQGGLDGEQLCLSAALGSKDQQPAAFNQEQPVLCADQSRLHGLRAFKSITLRDNRM